jgi:undecaprenyl diphosphate synthase
MADSPQHVAIIMDGNGRWARAHGLPRIAGHRSSIKVVRKVVEACGERQVRHLTLFAFSSENFQRPPDEVGMLMGLFLDSLEREIEDLHKSGVRLRFIGDRSSLGNELVRRMQDAEALTGRNGGLQLLVAVAYGGHWDIAQACRKVAEEVAAGELRPVDISEERIAAGLALAGVPDPDLLIRTGGEQRISNFLLWNLAYTELYFTEVLWPEFSTADLDDAFSQYALRERRFGRTSDQVSAKADA